MGSPADIDSEIWPALALVNTIVIIMKIITGPEVQSEIIIQLGIFAPSRQEKKTHPLPLWYSL
jgi:hypothetical protein